MMNATSIPFCHLSKTSTVYKGYCAEQVTVSKSAQEEVASSEAALIEKENITRELFVPNVVSKETALRSP
jgi:hypothetical protein